MGHRSAASDATQACASLWDSHRALHTILCELEAVRYLSQGAARPRRVLRLDACRVLAFDEQTNGDGLDSTG